MTWTSIIAIYLLFWVMTAFVILPIGVRTHDELGLPKTPGQADSAPGNFQPRKILRERHCCRQPCLLYIMLITALTGSIATVLTDCLTRQSKAKAYLRSRSMACANAT